MFNKQGQLDIFENFEIDRDLPKYQLPAGEEESTINVQNRGMGFITTTAVTLGNSLIVSGTTSVTIDPMSLGPPQVAHTWLQRWILWLLHRASPKGKELVVRRLTDPPPGPPEITVREFFSSLKNNREEMGVVDGRVRGYEAALERAKASGQKALEEQLTAGLEAARAETQLHAMGVTTYLTEETLVAFVKKSPKGLRLNWMKNFTRVVPDEVLSEKARCDERGVFDNYVVLHYDPKGKSWAETQEEKDARKDPILFGVVQGSRKLYFVGEWVDEFCDLSLDQIADVLYEGLEKRPGEATEQLDAEQF